MLIVLLQWNQCKSTRTVLFRFSASTNTPVFQSASSTKSYRAYVAVIEALEACTPRFCREQVIQRSGHSLLTPEDDEFIVNENLLLPTDYCKQASEGVSTDDNIVRNGNSTSEGAPDNTVPTISHMGPLSFDPRPALDQDNELTASDDPTELMSWHYRLGHLSFAKLKLLALLGEIPKRLANVKPPMCAGVLLAP